MKLFLKILIVSEFFSLTQIKAYSSRIQSSWLYCDDHNRNYAKNFTSKDFSTSWDYANDQNIETLIPYHSFLTATSGGIL